MNRLSIVDEAALSQMTSNETLKDIDGISYIVNKNDPSIIPEVMRFAKTNPSNTIFSSNPIRSTNTQQEIIELTPHDVISFYKILKEHIEMKMFERHKSKVFETIKNQSFF